MLLLLLFDACPEVVACSGEGGMVVAKTDNPEEVDNAAAAASAVTVKGDENVKDDPC